MGVSTALTRTPDASLPRPRKKGKAHYEYDERRKMVVFWNPDDDQPFSKDSMGFRCYGIPLDVWRDLGKPDFVTISVEARDGR